MVNVRIHAEIMNQIEVFDIEKESVIKTVPSNPMIQAEAENILKHIHDIYKKINPIPKKGLMMKIPIKPMIHVKNQWMDSLVDEMIIFYPEDEEPYIMTYDDENHFFFFTISNRKSANEFIINILSSSQ